MYELDHATGAILNSYPQGWGAQGLVVDRNDHVWVAKIFGDEVLHLAPNDPDNLALGHFEVGKVSGFSGTTGVAVDLNGFVWASEITGNSASRIDPTMGPTVADGVGNLIPVGVRTDTVSIGVGASPYNYSDMTGLVSSCIAEAEDDTRRMTGGGSFAGTQPDVKFRHGFELHCDLSQPNRLQINWGKGQKFHLTQLDSATCSDDPLLDEEKPVAGFDTFVGSGVGRLNGVDGATIDFTFTDNGEPGKAKDLAEIDINGGAITASGLLDKGNQQAHP